MTPHMGRLQQILPILNFALRRLSLRDLRQPAFPMNRFSGLGYIKVFRQDGFAADGALER